MKKGSKIRKVAIGYVAIVLTLTAIISVIALIYGSAVARFGDDNTMIAVVMLIAIVFFSVVCITFDYIRRRITVERPTNRILEATDAIAAGNFDVNLKITHAPNRYDDYDYIMENLNKMAAELSKTEILRTDFISNVSHELKTPLAVIQNYAMSLQGAVDDATRKEYAKTLVATAKRLTELISNILKLNKLENQELKLDFADIQLHEMLTQAVLSYEDLIDEKQLQLECDFDDVTVYSSDSLEIVWNNLLSNAIKFTDNGGKIAVSLKKIGDKAVVKIADNGCGISRESGAQIFDKFYQGDTSHSKEGNGLGLALVKKVIDVVGGEIAVESELGKGSVFTVKLACERGDEK